MPRVKIIHGPLLDRLGERETDYYGTEPLEEINASLVAMGEAVGVEVDCFQSDIEGEIVTEIANCRGKCNFLIVNPAAYSHTSVAIYDAIVFCQVPTVEVHLSNLASREPFRRQSTISSVVVGRLEGLGPDGYRLAMRFCLERLTANGI
ncbi:MAG: type II 3-dehydroquinate dehydratase [Candidatus Lernaella stagnicola]|nr:type II 3-dehydroquinate dehydratase [Candidatus Lernaella stagnicola]